MAFSDQEGVSLSFVVENKRKSLLELFKNGVQLSFLTPR